MKKLILLLLFVPLISFGQTKEEIQLCLLAQSTSFTSDSEADNALEKILGVIGLPKNFVLIPCSEIMNAQATSYKGIRYILYDKEFMRLVNSRTNDWSSLAILAHEVAHHVMGHALDLTMYKIIEPKTLAVRRKQELEADEWAGFIMARLGASLSQALSFTEIFPEYDDTYETHPTKSKRMIALKKGWNKGKDEIKVVVVNSDSNNKLKKINKTESLGSWVKEVKRYEEETIFSKEKPGDIIAYVIGENEPYIETYDKPKFLLNNENGWRFFVENYEDSFWDNIKNEFLNAGWTDSEWNDILSGKGALDWNKIVGLPKDCSPPSCRGWKDDMVGIIFFGNIVIESSEGNRNRYRFTGKINKKNSIELRLGVSRRSFIANAAYYGFLNFDSLFEENNYLLNDKDISSRIAEKETIRKFVEYLKKGSSLYINISHINLNLGLKNPEFIRVARETYEESNGAFIINDGFSMWSNIQRRDITRNITLDNYKKIDVSPSNYKIFSLKGSSQALTF